MTARDIHYKVKKWQFNCSVSQIQNWIEDLVNQTKGKFSHLKYMKDKLDPQTNYGVDHMIKSMVLWHS